MDLFHKYLKNIGFSGNIEKSDFGEIFPYTIIINNELKSKLKIPFLFYNNQKALFDFYLNEWNKNEISYFIAVGSDKTHIINVKDKIDVEYDDNILKSNLVIDSFNYGTNPTDYANLINLPFTRENIDNSYFFDFVLQKQKDIKNEVDTHLLNNLIELKKELSKFDTDVKNINNLILKSLFVKYLEDREILVNKSMVDVLKLENPSALTKLFSEIAVINGDILKRNLNITTKHINELFIFYTADYKEYKEGQPSLFYPYKFDKIPIQLISNVYEEFLGRTNKKEKKAKGIFYTRTFVIDFMLSHTIYPKIEKHANSTILDPACGSGAFLVQAFKKILNSQNKYLSIDEKAEILQKQIFGIDTDVNALQITAFSLYLTLLESADNKEIQKQIEEKTPILPHLIGFNLLQKNTIVDEIQFDININSNKFTFTKFDCIVANPPWSISRDKEIKKIHSDKILYSSIHNRYRQLSQFFLLKIFELSHKDTEIAVIVNSSNFYSNFSYKFRKDLLNKYKFKYYFELSDLKKILFKTARTKGAIEPASVLILDLKKTKNNKIKYISPKLNKFSEKLRIITYSSKEIKEVSQQDLLQEDILWRIFVNGDWKDYKLIKKILLKKSFSKVIKCQRGFEALQENKMQQIMKPIFIPIYNTDDKTNYFINDNNLNYFVWNRKLRRLPLPKVFSDEFFIKQILNKIHDEKEKELIKKHYQKINNRYFSTTIRDYKTKLKIDEILSKIKQSLFSGKRIIIERQPATSNKIKSVYTEQRIISKDNTLILKIERFNYYYLFLAILNSSIAGYFLSITSSQFSKGGRNSLNISDITGFPFPKITNSDTERKIIDVLNAIKKYKKQNKSTKQLEQELDELVFDLYELLEFEKEIIREFYKINVERKNAIVKPSDLINYVKTFRETYKLMIKDNLRLNASYIISKNIGAIVKFSIVDKKDFDTKIKLGDFDQRMILNLVKEHQIQKELLNGYINEEKVKIYDDNNFYIIKSNQFKDWTKRQALEDANEEVKEIFKKLL